jgi:hypothetical protein
MVPFPREPKQRPIRSFPGVIGIQNPEKKPDSGLFSRFRSNPCFQGTPESEKVFLSHIEVVLSVRFRCISGRVPKFSSEVYSQTFFIAPDPVGAIALSKISAMLNFDLSKKNNESPDTVGQKCQGSKITAGIKLIDLSGNQQIIPVKPFVYQPYEDPNKNPR